jgi:hypothetical protein
MLKSFLIVCLLVSPSLVTPQVQPKSRTIKGLVVAEYHWAFGQACYHVCGINLIVRLDKTTDEYVVVNIEYMDDRGAANGGRPVDIVRKAARWKFIGTLESESAPLEANLRTTDQSTGRDTTDETRIAAWRLLPEAEKEVLPFGKPIVRYAVKVGKFKRID